jgi:hypothetical protein
MPIIEITNPINVLKPEEGRKVPEEHEKVVPMEEITINVNNDLDISFASKHVGTFTGTFTSSVGCSLNAVIMITQNKTVSVSFKWPSGKPPRVPALEEQETEEFKKSYYLKENNNILPNGQKYIVQNEEYYFNKIELSTIHQRAVNMTGILFNRDGEEVGKFDMSRKQERRKSFSRQASTQVNDTLTKYYTLKVQPITPFTKKLFWFLVIAFNISLISWMACFSILPLLPPLFCWWLCFGFLFYVVQDEFETAMKNEKIASLIILPPALLWALVVYAGFGEGLFGVVVFKMFFFGVFVGIPARICCGFPKSESEFKGAILQTGMYAAGFTCGLIFFGACLYALFAGSIYLYTTPYTIGGLFVAFAVLPPIVYPVMYTIAYVKGVIHEWKWIYVVVPMLIINFILPFCLLMVGPTSYNQNGAMSRTACEATADNCGFTRSNSTSSSVNKLCTFNHRVHWMKSSSRCNLMQLDSLTLSSNEAKICHCLYPEYGKLNRCQSHGSFTCEKDGFLGQVQTCRCQYNNQGTWHNGIISDSKTTNGTSYYRFIEGKNCTDNGKRAIASKSECTTASKSLSLLQPRLYDKRSQYYMNGCIYMSYHNQLYFNDGNTNDGAFEKCKKDRECICKD